MPLKIFSLSARGLASMFFSELSPLHQPGRPYDGGGDGDRTLVVLLTFGIFFSFAILYLVAGLVWAIVITGSAVALSCFYLEVRARRRRRRRRRAVPTTGGAGNFFVVAAARSDGVGGLGAGAAAAAALVSAIPAFEYKRASSGGGGDVSGGGGDGAAGSAGWAQCVICLGLVQVGEVVRRLPACKHLFHVTCIDTWLRSHTTCPICRADVLELAAGRLEPPV
ncbi:hypothetical protein GUJ93_ZPchr0005g14485 [Zizania palustris]|uniref:RING-type E3 ubiquitin transferase n=1 Tax=Zizania palustris TaxID=103762 RepID=A0A8J5VHB2_ZIZPA|nr:hypothetical protein GUJ93_ZPchr0005g14485 [Zizania palustris]